MLDTQLYNNLIFELSTLMEKINLYRSNSNSDYVYSNVFEQWVKKYNTCLHRYNKHLSVSIPAYEIDEWDYSSTQKTMKKSGIKAFTSTIEKLINNLKHEVELKSKQKSNESTPYFQMRNCFKLGIQGCPINPDLKSNKIFIGMPFDNAYEDSYNFGIVPALCKLAFNRPISVLC